MEKTTHTAPGPARGEEHGAGPAVPPSVDPAPLALQPVTDEEVTTRIEKEGISYIFESRSLSAVVRFIYTPIDGTFSDLEVEINNQEPMLPADEGGIQVDMGGRERAAASEEIERHFVSCEQVGDFVEARWQWKCGEELADFLYRFALSGKTLVVEMEGGGGKATGVSLGRVSGAPHPRLLAVPYYNLGDGYPHVLCSGGVFVSSLLDWNTSRASRLAAPDTPQARQTLALNGGCTYLPNSVGRRQPLRERWLLTVSRRFEQVLPSLPADGGAVRDEMKRLVWYNVAPLPAGEESYVETYERLRTFVQWGMQDILVNHPAETWHDGDGNSTLHLDAAPRKGGDDALGEYLEAVTDLGYPFSLTTNYAEVAASNRRWSPEMAALRPDGNPVPSGPGQYRLKPSVARRIAAEHTGELHRKFHNPVLYLTRHTDLPPWEFIDCDSRAQVGGAMLDAFRVQRGILAAQRQTHPGIVVGDGGSHWLYRGVLDGHTARLAGSSPNRRPFLVDFDLRFLHLVQTDAGMGTPEDYYGQEVSAADRHSRSPFLDRYLAATVAYGHAGMLPDPGQWGLPAAVKAYYLLRQLQARYLGVPVRSIHYHHEGNLLELTEALISGAHEHSQVHVSYENGLQVHANGSWELTWTVERRGTAYHLPPGSFLAYAGDTLLVYSADRGDGRIDYARCPEYLYCDARGTRHQVGPVTLDGAAVVLQKHWAIDVLPLECQGEIAVDMGHFWPDRKLPPLRILGFHPDENEPESLKGTTTRHTVAFEPSAACYRYRITLPEWMVEPGR
ncbi:MAG: hypothetical protein AB1505_10055 [Candidatus Latescibacterota bacterium]